MPHYGKKLSEILYFQHDKSKINTFILTKMIKVNNQSK